MRPTNQSAAVSERSAVARYGVGAIAALAALAFRMALDPVLDEQSPYLPFALAVIVASRFGGRAPGLTASALSVLGAWYFLLEPRHSFALPSPHALGGLALFAVVASVISLFVGQLRHSLLSLARSEECLRLAEERLRLAALAAGVGVWSWTPGTSDVIVGADWRRLFGITADVPVTFETWREALHPEDRDHAVEELKTASEHHGEFDIEYRVVWPDGTVRWLADRGRASYDANGQAISMAGVNVDITERKQAEEKVRQQMAVQEGINRIFGQALSCETEEELRRACLAVAEGVTNSKFGFVGELDANGQLDGICGRVLLDGKAFYTNDPGSLPNSAGTPQGHPPLEAFLGVPLVQDGRTTGMIAVGNREGGYRQQDLEALEAVSAAILQVFLRRRAQEALRESEAQFRTLANAIPQLCWTANADGWITWYNQRWYEYTGTTPEQMEGWGWQSVHDPEMLPKVLERWKGSIASGEPFNMVFPLRGADGVFRPFLTRVMPVRDRDGEIARWFGTNTDISEQRKTEEALRESESRYRTLFESMQEGFLLGEVICDSTGEPTDWRYLEVNPALARMLRLDRGKIVGRTYRELFPDTRWQYWVNGFGRVALTGEPAHLDHFGDGTRRHYETIAYSAKPGQFAAILNDVTERKQAEEEICQLNAKLEKRVRERTAQLEAANKELEAFAYSVSHDLRAPLRGIDGWSLALMEDYAAELDERAQQYLERVRSETQRMGLLIDDMLQLSRITRAEMMCDMVDLSGVALAVAARLREAHAERNIDFIICPGLTAAGDARLLEIALTNLLGNAVKFTGPRAQARVEVGQMQQDGQPAFYVRDNGVGFDMTYSSTLFGAFQRLHKPSQFPGTGVGLATVQRIIHRHGGRVWAEAKPDQGATFYFTIGAV